jgi:hypothetical protein
MPLPRPLRTAAVVAAAALASTPAAAQDEGGRRIVIGVGQTFEAGRNLGLEVPDEGDTVRTTTRLSFGLSTATPLDRFEFAAAGDIRLEDGPGTSGTELSFSLPSLSIGYTREIPNALFGVAARARRGDVSDLGGAAEADEEGTQTDYGFEVRFETGRTGPASFSARAAYDVSEYEDVSDPTLTDTQTLTLDLGTRLRFSPVLTGIGGIGFTREDEDGGDRIDTTTVTLGLEHALRNGSASATLTWSTADDEGERVSFEVGRALELPAGSLSARIGVSATEEAGADIIGGVAWLQRLPDGSIGVSLSRSVSFDDDETTVDTGLAIDWTREIGPVSTIRLNAEYFLSDAPSERIEQTTLGATYSHTLTRDWQLGGGVRYILRDDADGRAESPSVFLSLDRSFAFRF